MEKRVTGIYFAVLLLGIIYAVFAAASAQNTVEDKSAHEGVVLWADEMEFTAQDGRYYYTRILPPENLSEKVIVYNTIHMFSEVFVDGKRVYALTGEPDAAIKTTGFYWNVIPLTQEYAGKEIVFVITPVYRDAAPKGDFYYGTYREAEHKILTERLFRLALACIIALAGIVMLLYGIFVVKKGQDAKTVIQFSIFAALLGVWSITETQILDWIFPGSMVIVFVSHLSLMTMLIPFMLFLRHMYHNSGSKLWSLCCYVNCAVIVVRVFLQMLGLYDLRETLWLTHLCIVLFLTVIIILTVQEIAVNKFIGQVKINSICAMVIVASVILELAIYRFGKISTPLGSMGFLFYIVVMGIINVRRSRRLMEQARENEIYRKLAFTDELTGLANRTAFREDLDKRMAPDKTTGAEKILPTIVFMFDLNDLKKCNDTYGHDYGDQYIQMAAEVLKKIFIGEGKCYRIGGDEFCAWAPYTSLDEINEKLRILQRGIQECNEKGFVVNVSISAGYAIYEEGVDGGGLYSTMKRADAMMYEKKQEYKRRIGK